MAAESDVKVFSMPFSPETEKVIRAVASANDSDPNAPIAIIEGHLEPHMKLPPRGFERYLPRVWVEVGAAWLAQRCLLPEEYAFRDDQ